MIKSISTVNTLTLGPFPVLVSQCAHQASPWSSTTSPTTAKAKGTPIPARPRAACGASRPTGTCTCPTSSPHTSVSRSVKTSPCLLWPWSRFSVSSHLPNVSPQRLASAPSSSGASFPSTTSPAFALSHAPARETTWTSCQTLGNKLTLCVCNDSKWILALICIHAHETEATLRFRICWVEWSNI